MKLKRKMLLQLVLYICSKYIHACKVHHISSSQDDFYIIVETYHKEGRGDEDNVHELDSKKLKDRTVVNIDIANDSVDANDYKKDEDPKTFKSEKTGRGPLEGDWKVRKHADLSKRFFL